MSALKQIFSGTRLEPTPVFESYFRFAHARQEVFLKRVAGINGPWTLDPIIAAHRFTNPYRASDRVSQYLIREVIYSGNEQPEEVLFRTLLFKLFNRIETWETLTQGLGEAPALRSFHPDRYAAILDGYMASGASVYSGAYIMPSPPYQHVRKHRNHLELLDRMFRDGFSRKVAQARSLEELYRLLLSYPSLGDFLAFQFAIDINYSELVDFSEMEFVVAGPGARNGLAKCFKSDGGLSPAAIISHVCEIADSEFHRLGLPFRRLGGDRRLQLIDCQNLFCEIDKYSRVAHPEFAGESGRTRIKQKFRANPAPLPQFYPPKWKLKTVQAQTRKGRIQPAPSQLKLLTVET